MPINVSTIDPAYSFEVETASYVGEPRKNTVMYITKKVEYLLQAVENTPHCLIYAENGVTVPEKMKRDKLFVMCANPRLEYVRFLARLFADKELRQQKRKYVLETGGYYLGENAHIGEESFIEPGCVIGHDVVIGRNARVYAGAVIKNAVIGDNFTANENCVVGTNGYVLTKDDDGEWLRIPAIGKVVIGNDVELGALDSVAVGTAGDTVIGDGAKIDAHVYIGHDSRLGARTEIPAGVVMGGYCTLEDDTFAGFNATLRNRICLGKGCVVGMGAVVTKSVSAREIVAGSPAKRIGWMCKCGARLDAALHCPDCGRKYRETDGDLEELK